MRAGLYKLFDDARAGPIGRINRQSLIFFVTRIGAEVGNLQFKVTSSNTALVPAVIASNGSAGLKPDWASMSRGRKLAIANGERKFILCIARIQDIDKR